MSLPLHTSLNTTIKDYCTWDGYIGQITSLDVSFTTNDKFELAFPFDTLYYEPHAGLSFKVLNNQQIELNPHEIEMIKQYQSTYKDTHDYPVWCYDSEYLYLGTFLKSEALEKDYNYTLIGEPDHPASKLVFEDHTPVWKKIKMVVRHDESVAINPDGLCPACVYGFTEEEYNEKVPPMPSGWHKWSITRSEWYDPRDIEDTRQRAKQDCLSTFDYQISAITKKHQGQRQMHIWVWEVEEARAYLDGTNPDPVYLKAFLDQRTDPGKPTLTELCQDVINNHNEYLIGAAKVNARLWGYLKELESLTTNAEIDEFNARVQKEGYEWKEDQEDSEDTEEIPVEAPTETP